MSVTPHDQPIPICLQEETISKLNLILLGNGDPEKGVAFKVMRMSDGQKQMENDISEIKVSMKEMTSMYASTIESVRTTNSALEKYKAETAKFEAGKSLVNNQRNQSIAKWAQVVATVVAILTLIFTYNSLKTDLDSKAPKMEITTIKPTSQIPDTLYKR